MLRIASGTLIVFSLLTSAGAMADEEKAEPEQITSITELVAPSESLYTVEWRYEIDDLDFQDNSPLGRISRIRELSLLTLAETRNSRVFFGVDSNGILGLHINAR